eukprot:7023970-Heterocapsa_arctica.AAC.1
MNSEPHCLWTTGVITKEYTALPPTDQMSAEDAAKDNSQKAQKCICWVGNVVPGQPNFKENDALKGKDQGSDRAEVRALLAALEKSIGRIEVITDNQYVRDTANGLLTGGIVHKGKHSDLWNIIQNNIEKLISIRWVKAHLTQDKAVAQGVTYEDWYGNDQADQQAKAGAEKHGYTTAQKFAIE